MSSLMREPTIRQTLNLYTVIRAGEGYYPKETVYQSLDRHSAEAYAAKEARKSTKDFVVSGSAKYGYTLKSKVKDLYYPEIIEIIDCDLIIVYSYLEAKCMCCEVKDTVSHIYIASYHADTCIVNRD